MDIVNVQQSMFTVITAKESEHSVVYGKYVTYLYIYIFIILSLNKLRDFSLVMHNDVHESKSRSKLVASYHVCFNTPGAFS